MSVHDPRPVVAPDGTRFPSAAEAARAEMVTRAAIAARCNRRRRGWHWADEPAPAKLATRSASGGRPPKAVRAPDGTVYPSQTAAAEACNITLSGISYRCNNGLGGWAYATEQDLEAAPAPPEPATYARQLAELDLWGPVLRQLQANGIKTVGDVAHTTRAELFKIDNFGPVRLAELQLSLDDVGVKIGEAVPEGHWGRPVMAGAGQGR